MYVLLTGGTGYVGSHAAVALAVAGHRTILLDNLCNSHPGVVDRIGRITGTAPVLVRGDVRDTRLVGQLIAHHRVEAVVHFAGLKDVATSVDAPLEYYDANASGTLSLLRAMDSGGARLLVFSSSATVYGTPTDVPIAETHPTAPETPYGRSKLHVEHMLADLAASSPGWRIASLRYFNPAGAHPSGLIGDDPSGLPRNLLPCLARVATGRVRELQVFGTDYPTPDGTGVRDYVHVMDLAEGHVSALARLQSARPGFEVFNLGTGRGYSVLEVIAAFERASSRPVPWRAAPRRPGDPPSSFADTDRARRVLGWSARRDLDTMCADAWRFARACDEREAATCS